jgi:hypothetical protein
MKKLKGEYDEVEQPQLKTGGDSEIAEVFYTGTGFHVGDGYLLTNRHVVVEPWKYDALSYLLSKVVSAQPRLVKAEQVIELRRSDRPWPGVVTPSRLEVCKLIEDKIRLAPSPWKAALHFEDPSHTAMPKIHRLAIHHRAASDQTVDVMSLALRYGLFGYAPLPERAVQPYVTDSEVCAFPDDLRGHVRVSHYHHGFDRLRD